MQVRQIHKSSPETWTLFGFSKEHLKAFRARMWTLNHLLDGIESERDVGLNSPDRESALRRLESLQDELYRVTEGLETTYGSLLLKFSTQADLDLWNLNVGIVRTDRKPIDYDLGPPNEILAMRWQIRMWDVLIAIHRLVEREFRPAVKNVPSSELELQHIFEALLIGKDIDYLPEVEIVNAAHDKRRVDFMLRDIDCCIELKLCNSESDVRRIRQDIHDDGMSYFERGRHAFFVVYDCGYIADSVFYESSLEHRLVLIWPRETVRVRVVKH